MVSVVFQCGWTFQCDFQCHILIVIHSWTMYMSACTLFFDEHVTFFSFLTIRTANFGQFFIALAGPFIVQGPPLLSAAWFPPHQRTTATSVASTCMIFGVAMSFIIGPLMVNKAEPDNLATM